MRIAIKMTGSLYAEIVGDLMRPHPFAAERIGFVMGRLGSLSENAKLLILTRHHSIPDAHYLNDRTVGARIGPEAMARAMQIVYEGRATREGLFHIHLHKHAGETGMSPTDVREIPKLIPGFQSVGRDAPHGIIILSRDHGSGWVWLPRTQAPILAEVVSVIGAPIGIFERKART